jgi:hypothetical protein
MVAEMPRPVPTSSASIIAMTFSSNASGVIETAAGPTCRVLHSATLGTAGKGSGEGIVVMFIAARIGAVTKNASAEAKIKR